VEHFLINFRYSYLLVHILQITIHILDIFIIYAHVLEFSHILTLPINNLSNDKNP